MKPKYHGIAIEKKTYLEFRDQCKKDGLIISRTIVNILNDWLMEKKLKEYKKEIDKT